MPPSPPATRPAAIPPVHNPALPFNRAGVLLAPALLTCIQSVWHDCSSTLIYFICTQHCMECSTDAPEWGLMRTAVTARAPIDVGIPQSCPGVADCATCGAAAAGPAAAARSMCSSARASDAAGDGCQLLPSAAASSSSAGSASCSSRLRRSDSAQNCSADLMSANIHSRVLLQHLFWSRAEQGVIPVDHPKSAITF